jgi:nucleoid-associated protein YgaU
MEQHRPSAAACVAVTVPVVLLVATGQGPASAWVTLSGAGTAADPVAPLLALITLLAWTTTGWLLVTVAATAGGHLPGDTGRLLAGLARRLAPVAVRRTVELTLGLTVVAGGLAGPAAASSTAPAPAAAPRNLDWSGLPAEAPVPAATPARAGDVAAPDLDWTLDVPSPGTAVTASPAAPARTVVVQPGDTLWGLAEAELRTTTGTPPADSQVAQAWPSWWAANRDAVGPDPHLLLPGTALHPPQAG